MEMSIMAMLPIRCVLLSFFFMTPLEPSTLPGRSCSLWALFVLQLESVFEVRRGLQWVQYPSGTFLFFCFYSLEAMDFLFHFHSWTVYWSIRSVFRSRLALFVKIWRSWRQLLLSILQRPFLGYLLSDTKEPHSWCSNKVFFKWAYSTCRTKRILEETFASLEQQLEQQPEQCAFCGTTGMMTLPFSIL